MELSLKRAIVQNASNAWQSGDLLKVGFLLFERIPRSLRPRWGADALEMVYRHIPPVDEIMAVIQFARTPDQWAGGSEAKGHQAHDLFGAVRDLTLLQDKGKRDDLYTKVLLLAENVAKVTYNAYDYSAPFDHHAGWWIPGLVKGIVGKINEPKFSDQAWEVLTRDTYLQLETPVRCNPHCPTCGWLVAFEIST